MTLRTFVDKNGNEWNWQETPEVLAALVEYRKVANNYSGPLYAPHPNLKNETQTNTKSTDVG